MPAEKAITAFVVPYKFVPPANGGQHAAYGLADFVSRRRPLFTVSTLNNEAIPTPFALVRLFGNRAGRYADPVAAWRLFRLFRRKKVRYCIIHQHFIGLLLKPVLSLLGIPLLIYVQNIEFQRFRSMGKWWWRLIYWSEKIMYRKADFLLFISPDDLETGKQIFELPESRCLLIPYGTYLLRPPGTGRKCRDRIIQRHRLHPDSFLLLFFGAQSYLPNLEAVERIALKIEPRLREKAAFPFRFLICGGGLPKSHDNLKERPNMEFLGFVDDLEEYILAADLVINPVVSGGGVKTKIIESVALGKTVLSSRSGAAGMDTAAAGAKLQLTDDQDEEAWAEAIIQLKERSPLPETPPAFYQTYYWGQTIRPLLDILQ